MHLHDNSQLNRELQFEKTMKKAEGENQLQAEKINENDKPNYTGWLHWLVINNPQGSDSSKRDLIVKYKRPLLYKGGEPQRYVMFL